MKKKFEVPVFNFFGSGVDVMFGYNGANTEWDSMGNTRPCAGCLS
nr:hypothetical protein [Paenibacillus bovis]